MLLRRPTQSTTSLWLFWLSALSCRSLVVNGSWIASLQAPNRKILASRTKPVLWVAGSFDEDNDQQSSWDSLKSTIYGGIDSISSIQSKLRRDSQDAQSPEQELPPGERMMTVYQRKVSSRNIQQISKTTQIKGGIYDAADQVVKALEDAREFPTKAQNAVMRAEEVARRVPNQIKDLEQSVASIPGKIKSTADNIQSSIEDGIDTVTSIPGNVQTSIETGMKTTIEVIDNVKAIPNTVQNKVIEIQDTAQRTKSNVDDAVFEAKVLVGMEERKPKPPRVKPSLSTKDATTSASIAKDMALKTTGAVASGTAKAAWFVGKGVFNIAGNAAQKVWSDLKTNEENFSSTKESRLQKKERETSSSTKQEIAPSKNQATVAKTRNSSLDKEIDEVLKFANDAMENANKALEKANDNDNANKTSQ